MANVSVAQHEELRKAARRIRDRYPGARVILFGSAARGTSGTESDVDLCVVIDRAAQSVSFEAEIEEGGEEL